MVALGLHGYTQALSSRSEQRLLFLAVHRLLIAVASLAADHRLRHAGFGGCSMQNQWLYHTGLASQWSVESSRARDQNHFLFPGRWILKHCTTREVPNPLILNYST